MNRRRSATAALVAAIVLGAAACTAAPPEPTPAAPRSSSTTPSARPSASAAAPHDSQPATTSRPSASRLDLEIGTINPDWLWPMLEFASDSYGIIWSSAVADGPHGTAAPDLWRWVPGDDEPQLLWSNPHRDRQLAKIAGDTDVWAFAEISSEGEDWWNLWLLEEGSADAILLDALPPGTGVPSLVPAFDVDDGRVAWTSFAIGAVPGSTVSELWFAEAPAWEPRLVARHDAAARALWLPSLYGHHLAYVEVTLAAETTDDVRHVMLLDLFDPDAAPVQLDISGNATMPVVTDGGVIWKEPDVGFAMFNWGRLFRYSFENGSVVELRMGSQEYVNYPSGGSRFVAAWGADTSVFSVHDLERRSSRLVIAVDDSESIVRPHVAGELLVWMRRKEHDDGSSPPAPLEWAWLPVPGSDRGN